MADMGQLISRAQTDDEFRRQIKADPRASLAQYGVQLPNDVEVKVLESDGKVFYLPLPPALSEELSDEQLEAVGGGDSACCCCSCACSCS